MKVSFLFKATIDEEQRSSFIFPPAFGCKEITQKKKKLKENDLFMFNFIIKKIKYNLK